MADETREEPGQWRLESAGLHMRADATEAGKLVRLADVVRWMIEAKELPRRLAVEKLCEALEAAPVAPVLFWARPDEYATTLAGDAALFGFHTPETWAVHQIARETLDDMHRNPWHYDFRNRERPWVDNDPPSVLSAEELNAIREEVRNGRRPAMVGAEDRRSLLCEPGIPAAVRYIRERWPTPPRRRGDSTTARDALDDVRGRAFGLSVRVSSAQALWGWGTKPADVAPQVDQDAPSAAYTAFRAWAVANKGAPWSDDQFATVQREIDRRGRGGQASVAKDIEVTPSSLGGRLSYRKAAIRKAENEARQQEQRVKVHRIGR